METAKLKKFAQFARCKLVELVSVKLRLVLEESTTVQRESLKTVKKLEKEVNDCGKEKVIEKVAYVWFNRFCALRFMDVNHYTRIGVVSPAEGQFQPEILAEAKMGHVDEKMVQVKVRKQIFDLLDGKVPSHDPQGEAYRLLFVATCNFWNNAMPFLFQRIDDYTELLLPDDLLSGNSILAYTREAMTPDACEDVEVIGWLYQFYISEKKDEIFDALKRDKKITPENISTATQLFTPNWIVRYLVENSLGRLWLLNRPNSKLSMQMDYYIRPEQVEADFLRINRPEEIKICDPACGSGHMLTYAFDLLYFIYEEEGYEYAEIPEKILTHNLYGIEIDERAGELAAFALTMKARAKQRQFFSSKVKPNICVLENIHFDEDELKNYINFIGRDLFTAPLQTTLHQFEEANNFGSLIRPYLTDVNDVLKILESKNPRNLFLRATHKKVLQVLQQTDYLGPKYHVVVANPPYMGRKKMNVRLSMWLTDNYPDVKHDLFSAFIIRNTELTLPKGHLGFMSPFVWMFILSYEKLRSFLLTCKTITSLVQLEYSGFDEATVPICTFTVENANRSDLKGSYIRLSDFRGYESQGPRTLEAIQNPECGWFYRVLSSDFSKIPGMPLAYWISDKVRNAFAQDTPFGDVSFPKVGMQTSNNDKYLRLWTEVSFLEFKNKEMPPKWIKYLKGGPFRRWYGNLDYLLRYNRDSQFIKQQPNATVLPETSLKEAKCTWTDLTSGPFSCRFAPEDTFHDISAHCFYPPGEKQMNLLAYSNTRIFNYFLSFINASFHFQVGDIAKVPVLELDPSVSSYASRLVSLSKEDWDSFENSWDFTNLPLLNPNYREPTLKATYQKLRAHWWEMTLEMQRLEEENNRIFINVYGLEDELTSDVPLNEITLTCNPYYRYSNDKRENELEALLLADTMRELISYSVGCMFGRYALEKPGLILANQGETIDDYRIQVPEPNFSVDDDNVIPMLDGNWFSDDIVDRFREFLRVAFGDKHYEQNIQFVENALGKNGKARDIRNYFLKDFYNDHVRRYKNRPIYWLFSSPKGNFNALIYMHRYRPETVSVVLNDYLREFRTKLTSHKDHLEAVDFDNSSSKREKIKALKEIEKLNKMITEMEEYEHDVLYPLATKQVKIDLDDGVKVNYLKLGVALKKIAGLNTKKN